MSTTESTGGDVGGPSPGSRLWVLHRAGAQGPSAGLGLRDPRSPAAASFSFSN